MSTLNITKLVAGAVATADSVNQAFTEIENWANGNIDDTNLATNASIGNSKLSAPKSWFSKLFSIDVSEDRSVVFEMPPVSATLVHFKVYCYQVPALNQGEYLIIDLKANGSSVLNTTIQLDTAQQMYSGDLAQSQISASAQMTVSLDHPGGTVGTFGQVTVDILFKLNHVA